jgi:hypothetical protein
MIAEEAPLGIAAANQRMLLHRTRSVLRSDVAGHYRGSRKA